MSDAGYLEAARRRRASKSWRSLSAPRSRSSQRCRLSWLIRSSTCSTAHSSKTRLLKTLMCLPQASLLI